MRGRGSGSERGFWPKSAVICLFRDQLEEYDRSRDTYFIMRSHALFVVVIEYTCGELMFAWAVMRAVTEQLVPPIQTPAVLIQDL